MATGGGWLEVGLSRGAGCGLEWGGIQSSPRDALAVFLPSQVAAGKAFLPRELSVGLPLMFPHLCSSKHPARQGSDGFKRPNAATLRSLCFGSPCLLAGSALRFPRATGDPTRGSEDSVGWFPDKVTPAEVRSER